MLQPHTQNYSSVASLAAPRGAGAVFVTALHLLLAYAFLATIDVVPRPFAPPPIDVVTVKPDPGAKVDPPPPEPAMRLPQIGPPIVPEVVIESADIMFWLERRFPEPGFTPEGPADRAAMEEWVVRSATDHVKAVTIIADKNPTPDVCVFHFTPACGRAQADTRMRLGVTQDVIAVAEMSNGDFYMTRAEVKVTIGGCGG